MFAHAINHINFNTKECNMVKRGGKEVITVEIFKETYDVMKANAEKKRWNTKDYINTVLMEAIERDKFLQSYAPSLDRKSTRLNSSHVKISYAVFCLKKKKN